MGNPMGPQMVSPTNELRGEIERERKGEPIKTTLKRLNKPIKTCIPYIDPSSNKLTIK